MKKCTYCKQEKELKEFSKNETCRDGRHTECKICKAKRDRDKQKERKFYKQFEII